MDTEKDLQANIPEDMKPQATTPGNSGEQIVINPEALSIVDEALAEPTEEEQAAARQREQLMGAIVPMSKEFPVEEPVITLGDVKLCGRRDIVTVKAAPKNGKTSLLTAIRAAILSGHWGPLQCHQMGLSILYADTEQDYLDTQRIGRMALSMAGLPEAEERDGYWMVNLRKFGPDEIVKMVEGYLEMLHPDVLFLDGVLDMTPNFNDVEQSQELVKNCLLRWADTYNCVIFCAIHTNKTNDTHISQGHLGAMLDKKGEATLECIKDAANHIVRVSAPTNRHRDIPSFYFAFAEDGTPIPGDEQGKALEEAARQKKEQKEAEKKLKKLVEDFDPIKAMMQQNGGLVSEVVLRNFIREKGIRHRNNVTKFIEECKISSLLYFSEESKCYSLQPFTIDAVQEDLPF